MNELLFFLHIGVVVGFLFLTLWWGRVALITYIVLQMVLANLFVLKQTHLFGLTVTCSDVFAIGMMLGLNMLRKKYGQKEATQTITLAFFLSFLFCVLSQFHLLYRPIDNDLFHTAFVKILQMSPRIIFSSMAVFFISSRIDLKIFGLLQRFTFPWRSGLCIAISQLVDTVFFSYIGLYGIVSSIFDVMVMSYLVKCMILLTSSLFVSFSIKHLPQKMIDDFSF